jgi:hypothetical protein
MAICICCLYEVHHFRVLKDGLCVCDYCLEEGMAKIERGSVVIKPVKKPPEKKRRGRPPKNKNITSTAGL